MCVNMAGFIHQYFWQRIQRRSRVFRERINPLQELDDAELHSRYRFRRPDILRIVDLLRNDLEFGNRRRDTLSAEMQVLVALRFYASGSFQNVLGDTVHKSTVSRIVHRRRSRHTQRSTAGHPHCLHTGESVAGFRRSCVSRGRRHEMPLLCGTSLLH